MSNEANVDLKNNKCNIIGDEEKKNNFIEWISFYRENPHRFVKDYLGVTLRLFQQVILYQMFHKSHSMFLACRGVGKTFLVAVFCCVYCILYPGAIICVASYRRDQASETLGKIKDILIPMSPNLKNEIASVTLSKAQSEIVFKNNSIIKVVTSADSARGKRANVLVVDEFRLVKKDILDGILKPFLANPRHPRFLDDKKYEGYRTEPLKEIYASSCWYESHWSYALVREYFEKMIKGESYFVCSIPYQIGIKEGILDRQIIEDKMSERTFNEILFRMEHEALFWSQPAGGLFSLDDIDKNRVLKQAMYPSTTPCAKLDKTQKIQPKKPGEIRILSADIALMASGKVNNDATSIFINQVEVLATGEYLSHIVYTENNEGLRTDAQALVIRRLFEEFDCDYLVIDAKNVGLSICDALMDNMYDPEKGVTYEAIGCCNDNTIQDRCAVKNAPRKLWAIKGNPEFNSQCALGLREALRNGSVKLLVNEYEAEELIGETMALKNLSPQDLVALKLPYIHTTLLASELINLKCETSGGGIRVKEKAGMRKDRYSSLSYNIWVTKQLEREAAASKNSPQDMVACLIRPPKISKNYKWRK